MLKLFNTLTRKKEIFKPLRQGLQVSLSRTPQGKVGIYCCGPTVYDFAHIGNLRTYLFEDILKRVLEYNGYKVKHIMNITDVGHLTSDADTGEDKLEKGAKREKKTVWEIAEFYTRAFKKDLRALNILEPDVWLKATDTIKEQIDLIKILEKKGFTYTIEDGVYFDTSRLKKYGVLWGSKKPVELRAGARVEMVRGKKHPTDFALWKLTPKGVKRQMEWDSPWGRGFPGWHTECVVMSAKALGTPFDIHCGGIDHISIHHTNEIAQAEAAFGNVLANFWLHGEFLNIQGGKMAKSAGSFITLDSLTQKGFNPLAYRYLCLTAHYRSKLAFSWESLQAAENALGRISQQSASLKESWEGLPFPRVGKGCPSQDFKNYQKKFLECINDDLNMPKAVALMWQMLDDKKLTARAKYALLLDFDKVFGLGLGKIKKQKIPKEILELVKKREECRKKKEWQKADALRERIKKAGYEIEDTKQGPKTIKT